MVNDNETVDQVCEEMKEVTGTRRFIDSHYCNHCGDQIDGEGSALDVYSDRILAAHKRDIVAYELELDRWFHQGHKDRAKIKSLRTKNEKLRKLVKELASALTTCMRDELDGCATRSEREEVNKHRKEYRALVARAREMKV